MTQEQLDKTIQRCIVQLVVKKGLSYSGATSAVHKMVKEYQPEIQAKMYSTVINSLEKIFLGKYVTATVA